MMFPLTRYFDFKEVISVGQSQVVGKWPSSFSDEWAGWMVNLLQSTGLSLRAGGRGFSLATKRVAPGYFYWKIEEK